MIEADTTNDRIDPREVHEILSNDRRRNVLKQLQHRLEPISLRELSERIAAVETNETPPPRNIRDSVYNSLHQTHLPKLDEKGVIDYDQERKTVRLCEPAKQVDLYMEVVTRYGITWAVYYRTFAVVSLVLIVASELGAPLVSSVPTLLWTSLALFVVAGSTAVQLWKRRWFYLQSLLGPE